MKRLKLLAIVLAGILLFSALPVVAGESVSKYYTDVTQKWAVEGIDAARENGLMIGVSENRFAPSGTFSTGQFAMVLWRLAGEPEAKDDQTFEWTGSYAGATPKEYRISDWISPKENCYFNPTVWAAENGYLEHDIPAGGTPNFYTLTEITRHEIIVGLCFYAHGKGVDVTPNRAVDIKGEFADFNDELYPAEMSGSGLYWWKNVVYPDGGDKISEWDAWAWAISTGIIEGYEDKTLRIENEVTRAQFATILQRFLTVYPELAPQK